MRLKLASIALSCVLPALPAAAAALNLHDLLAIRHACGNDIKALCAGTERGQGRIAQCMVQHESEVSAACAETLKAERAKLPAAPAGDPYDTD